MDKICRVCQQLKPVNAFQSKGVNRRWHAICKRCRRHRKKAGQRDLLFVERYAGHDENHRICIKCGIEKLLSDFNIKKGKISYTCLECVKNLCVKCCVNPIINNHKWCVHCLNRSKEYKLRCRHFVLDYFGGKCVFCDNNEYIFLTIDHVNGGGKVHRKNIKDPNIYAFLYGQIKKSESFDKSEYQVLCWSCNSAKHIYGEDIVREAVLRLKAKNDLGPSI